MSESFIQFYPVAENQTALALGSGTLNVLATPALVAMVENTAMKFVEQFLNAGETTVGSHLDIDHLRPSAVGAKIKVACLLDKREKNQFFFSYEAFEGEKKIATGKHTRVSVNTENFLARLTDAGKPKK